MASDLSTLIQDGICSTLNGLLAKEASIKETNKAVAKDFESLELLKVESSFEFDNINSTWEFYIPAYSASLIFNSMLGDDSEPVLEIDPDIADALSEFISNLSGGLTTAINGSGFEDLGQSKFAIGENETVQGNDIEDFDNTFKFSIDLEGKDILLFIKFDKIIIPFLSIISQSSESVYETEAEIIEELEEGIEQADEDVPTPDESEEEIKAQIDSPNIDESSNDKEIQNTPNENNKEELEPQEEIEELNEDDKKAKKLKIIIIGVAALLTLTIITGIIMYFLGMFDPEPIVKTEDLNSTKIIKRDDNVEVVKYDSQKKTNFKVTQINVKRLNARLELLTKYEVMSEEDLKKEQEEKERRLKKIQKEQELIEFAKANKEEDIFAQVDTPKKSKEDMTVLIEKKQVINSPTKQTIQEVDNLDEKMRFVLIHSLKYKLYKELISKTNTSSGRISICKNNMGRTSVYLGPFDTKEQQEKMLKLIADENISQATSENLNEEEFNARCNFE